MKAMKIAFVHMNSDVNVGRGAGYVAGAILRAGYELTFFDTLFITPQALTKEIIKNNFDVLMVSTMTMLFPDALRIIREVKQKKNIPTLMGGIHPTIMGSKLLETHEEIDYLCVGEGESMVINFLEHLNKDSLYDVKNLAYRRNNQVCISPIDKAEDLTKLPPFPWHLFRNKEIVQESTGFLYVAATRGCPFNCSYCCNGVYLKQYGKNYLRFRTIAEVMNELKYLYKTYSPSLFYFADEMIFAKPDYAVELFQTIKQELNIPYGCMARVEYINPQIVDVLHKTGCNYIAMGVESGNEEFRRRYLNRAMTNDQIEKAFSMVSKRGIFTSSFNMIGFPFENDDFLTEETLKLNQKIKPDYAQCSIFYPFPGTKLYDRCIELDLIDHQKLTNTKDYYIDSVLKGVHLKEKIQRINNILNPQGIRIYNAKNRNLFRWLIRRLRNTRFSRSITSKVPNHLRYRIRKLLSGF